MPRQIIVGVCRFSFFGRSDNVAWRGLVSPAEGDLARIAAALYARPRLTRRLHSFKRICLASVRAQTDRDFIFLVVTSPELPGWAREQLAALCASCENVELIVSDADSVDQALAGPLRALGGAGDEIVLFRLDDDDALHVGFVAALRRHAARMQGLPAFAVSFARNLAVSVYPDKPVGWWMIERPFTAAGLAVRLPPGRGLFSYGHFAMRRRITNLTDLDQIGALIVKWPADARADVVGQARFGYQPLEEKAFRKTLQRSFPFLRGFDFEALRRPPDAPRGRRRAAPDPGLPQAPAAETAAGGPDAPQGEA